MAVISVRNLSAYYENKKIFENMNFDVQNGDYLCITGENGSGKTTLMRCILGFSVKHTGSVLFDGLFKNEIGWLPQHTNIKSDFPASVVEIIMSGFAGKKFLGLSYTAAQKKKAEENMKTLEITDLKNCAFSELSGGQQQKVLLCRVLCCAEKILLLDEPVTGLDTASQKEMYSIIRKLNNMGMTIIMISHDIGVSLSEAKHILNISENGYFFGTCEEFTHFKNGENGERNI